MKSISKKILENISLEIPEKPNLIKIGWEL